MHFLLLIAYFITTQLPTDGGTIYRETIPGGDYLAEPWNAISSLSILLPAVYWAWKLRGRYREYPFITFCIPLLFLGGLGSTLFHALRNSRLLLLLDVTPTAILMLSLAIYFWVKILPKWWWVIPIVAASLLWRFWARYYLPLDLAINITYAVTGSLIFIPTIILLYRTRMAHSSFIIVSAVFFITSLIFRKLDSWEQDVLPMGTHFLWHIFSGVGAFFLAEYLYKVHLKDAETEI
ncbi:hypothetical protein [Nafulsella turpanensis]|uniref:hypothetical protein n=1 Tax=Nafulsella turpanensis TaxID=1265690 RepID=UPI0003461029|nr:hypothetical protein [Nafulsella turpanensis]